MLTWCEGRVSPLRCQRIILPCGAFVSLFNFLLQTSVARNFFIWPLMTTNKTWKLLELWWSTQRHWPCLHRMSLANFPLPGLCFPQSACPKLVFSNHLCFQQIIGVSNSFWRTERDGTVHFCIWSCLLKSSVWIPLSLLFLPILMSGLSELRIRHAASYLRYHWPGWRTETDEIIGVLLQKKQFGIAI